MCACVLLSYHVLLFSQATADSKLCDYLQSLVDGHDEDALPHLIEMCVYMCVCKHVVMSLFISPSSCREAKGGHYFGELLVDRAVTAIFAALVWHLEEIREELSNNCESCDTILFVHVTVT